MNLRYVGVTKFTCLAICLCSIFAVPQAVRSQASSVLLSKSQVRSGETIVVVIHIDMKGVPEPDHLLGSFTGSLEWDASVLAYVSSSSFMQSFTGLLNDDNAAEGRLSFNGANAQGVADSFGVLEFTFEVIGATGSSTIMDLEYSAMASAFTFVNLLPGLTIHDGEVFVNTPPAPFSLVEPANEAVIDTLNPTLIWEAAPDADTDAGDEVRYHVLISTSESFSDTAFAAGEVADTSLVVAGGLEPARQYFWKVTARDKFGGATESATVFQFTTSDIATDVDEEELLAPDAFELLQNYPNPFNPETTIRYQIPESVPVMLTIYNLLGERIRTLVDAVQPAGRHQVRWDGTDAGGRAVASGIYVARLEASSTTQVRKLTLLR